MQRIPFPVCAAMATMLLVVLAATGSATADDLSAAAATFQISSDPDKLVIRFSERLGEIEDSDHPSLRIYADGRVIRHRPGYMKQPGDHIGQVTADELKDLLSSLAGKGIMEFDSESVRSTRLEAQGNQPTLSYSSDPSLFEIEINLDTYQPAGNLTAQPDFQKIVSWHGLRHDARQFPELTAIQDLASACTQLDALAEKIEREGLTSSGEGGGS